MRPVASGELAVGAPIISTANPITQNDVDQLGLMRSRFYADSSCACWNLSNKRWLVREAGGCVDCGGRSGVSTEHDSIRLIILFNLINLQLTNTCGIFYENLNSRLWNLKTVGVA